MSVAAATTTAVRLQDRYEVELTSERGNPYARCWSVWVYRADIEEELERDGLRCVGGVYVDEDGFPLTDEDYYNRAVEIAQRR